MDGSSEQRIGPYRIERELGRGGMGVVYLASRSDNAYYKQVAIKLLQASMQQEEVQRRFRSERQILASLEHPNIARLLDGGTTEQGEPYIVMEFVRGAKSLKRYAMDAELDTRQKLELFLVVCRAVQHAHQRLVIHRDLKPSNILVTPEGDVKLVDFGIAKLLLPGFWPQDAPDTRTGMQAMTPEYASPEQIRGESISVASDVYTLGVVLYELLSGELPFRRTGEHNVLSLLKEVLEHEPVKPSAHPDADLPLRQELEGDLDNIILMAIRKEEEKRYQSVEQLAADIQRYLDGQPVMARASTFTYRASKFVRRNQGMTAAAALVVLSLVSGVTSTLREYSIAESQRIIAQREASEARKQRERAEQLARLEQASRTRAEEKAREAEEQTALARRQTELAESRFETVRKVITQVVFDVEGAIRHLPGATPARKLVVENTRKYLDELYQTAQDHAQLQGQLAFAYVALSRIQRAPNQTNLGDSAGAAESLKRGLELARRSLALDPKLRTNLTTIAGALSYQGDLLTLEGKLDEAIPLFKESLAVAREAAKEGSFASARAPLTPLAKLSNASLALGRQEEGVAYQRQALEITTENLRRYADQPTASRDHHVSLNLLATTLLNERQDAAGARALLVQIPPLLDKLEKGGANLLRDRMVLEANLGRTAEREKAYELALHHFTRLLSMAEQILRVDDRNYLAILDTVSALTHVGETFPKVNRPAEGVPHLRRARELSDTLTAIDAKSVQTFDVRMQARKELALALSEARMEPEAAAMYREMMVLIDKEMPAGKGQFLSKTAAGLAEAGDFFLQRQPPDARAAQQAYTKAADIYRLLKREKDVQEITAALERVAAPPLTPPQ